MPSWIVTIMATQAGQPPKIQATPPQIRNAQNDWAGGIGWDSVNEDYSLKAAPRVFVAGEMLDWEAPTGGYLLQASLATGAAAARAIPIPPWPAR